MPSCTRYQAAGGKLIQTEPGIGYQLLAGEWMRVVNGSTGCQPVY
jgi:hypothetical protein